MEHSYHDLRSKRVTELREIAKAIEHEAVQGYTQLNKDHLVLAICTALGIDAHEHHHATGVDTKAIKAEIKQLKAKRAAALEAHDPVARKRVRRRIHRLKHKLRRAMV